MEAELVSRAVAAATSLAGAFDLRVDDAVVIHDSNKLGLRLLPCDVFARVALVGHEVSALEVEIAQRLAAMASPVAALEPRVDPRVYEADGFAVTFWTYYAAVTPDRSHPPSTQTRSNACTRGCAGIEIATPHLMERVAQALRLVANRDETPALSEADRQLLGSTLQSARRRIHGRGAAEQLLHGEPHPGNLISAQDGPVFIDLETCCRGPIEFDVAHVPDEVSAHYPDVDPVLLDGMSAARSGDGRCLAMGRPRRVPGRPPTRSRHPDPAAPGPPWPALGALSGE